MENKSPIEVPVLQGIQDYRKWLQELIYEKRIQNQVIEWLRAYAMQQPLVGLVGTNVQLSLCSAEHATLTVRYRPPILSQEDIPPEVDLASSPIDRLVAVLGEGRAKISFYKINGVTDANVFSDKAEVHLIESVYAQDGDIFFIGANKDIFDIVECPTGVVLAELIVENIGSSIVWHFDKSTLRATRVTGASRNATRQQVAIRTLKHLNCVNYVEALQDVARNCPWYFVRWDAIRELVASYPEVREQTLRSALKDAHPHIRTAAKMVQRELKQA